MKRPASLRDKWFLPLCAFLIAFFVWTKFMDMGAATRANIIAIEVRAAYVAGCRTDLSKPVAWCETAADAYIK